MSRRKRKHLDVRASAEPTSLNLTGSVEFEAAKPPAEGETAPRPRFTIAAYSGAPVVVGGFFSPVILELTGMKASRQKMPILRDHDPGRIVGQSDKVDIDASGVRLSGVVTGDNSDATEVVSQSKNGFEWQASIGANITRREFLEAGKTAQVNGREVAGPMIIARESVLHETSFVAIGADQQTSASVAASHSRKAPTMDPKFRTWLEAKGISVENKTEQEMELFQAAWKQETGSGPKPRVQDVIANARKEEERRERIADITAQFIADNPGRDADFIQKVESLAMLAIEANWSEEKYDTELLRASRPNPYAGFRPPGPGGSRINSRIVEAAICQAGRLQDHEKKFDDQTLQAAHDHFKGRIGLKQLFLICAEHNGYRGSYATDVTLEVQRAAFGMSSPNHIRASGGFSTLSISNVLAATANKFLMDGWNAVDMTPMRISAIRPVRDFKTITTVSLTGDLMYEQVGPAGEIKHGTLSDLTYTNKADTYARMLAITRQDIINDDLGALTAVPRRLGRGAALKLNDLFWTVFLGAETAGFFAAGNSNVNTGVADMTIGGLAATETIFLNQTDPDGKPLGIEPKIIVVPTALKATAIALMDAQSKLITGASATLSDVNVFAGRFRVESSPYMSNSAYTGFSASAWYMLADPMDLPMIEIVALNGRVEPIVETADAEFNTLGVQMRGYSDIGVALQEYRAAVKPDGGSS